VSDPRIVRAGPERIPELEPLWRALYEHHRAIAEGVAGVRPYEDTWKQRRGQYRDWLTGDGDAVLLLADRDGRAVGYAMLTAGPGAATWNLGDRVVEIETLSSVAVGLAHTNEGARRFYEREGFTPFYLDMVLDIDSGILEP
jgi:GNAT superfamily N-acetyltransferase